MAGESAILRKESPVALLLLKLEKWMVLQPEWLLIVEMPRQQRRAAMRELANRLYTIPIMDGVNTVPRQVRRKASKELAHAARTGQLTDQVRAALATATQMEVEETTPEGGKGISLRDPAEATEAQATEGGVLLEDPLGGLGASESDVEREEYLESDEELPDPDGSNTLPIPPEYTG